MKLVPKVEKLSIYDSSAPTGHWIRPRQWLWNHQFGTWIKRNILPADDGKGPHATSTSGLPPLGLEAKIDIDRERSLYPSCVSHYLDRPVVSPDLSCRETTGCTSLLLDVERNLQKRSIDLIQRQDMKSCLHFRISCRWCASCCAAFQRSWFPWSSWSLTPLLWNMWALGNWGPKIRAQGCYPFT